MATKPGAKHFSAHIDPDLWERWEQWTESGGRGKISNRQAMNAWVRLFVNAPERLKDLALNGKEEDIRTGTQEWLLFLAQEVARDAQAATEARRQIEGRSVEESP